MGRERKQKKKSKKRRGKLTDHQKFTTKRFAVKANQ